MKITYKLVGTREQLNIVKEIDRDEIKYSLCIEDIKGYGYDGSFESIIFICRSKKLINDSITFKNHVQQVFIFSQNKQVKMKLLEIFREHTVDSKLVLDGGAKGIAKRIPNPIAQNKTPTNFTVLPQQDLKKPVEQKVPTLDDDELLQNNESILKTLTDTDFITLMRIYKHKSNLLATAYNYVSSGSLVNDNDISDIKVKSLNEKEKDVFIQVNKMITQYNYKVDSDLLNKLIRHFKGNVSLIFRYIYQDNLKITI
jgi:hypothetical protein